MYHGPEFPVNLLLMNPVNHYFYHESFTMKQLFLLLLILPFFSKAQECHLKKETDRFSQLPKYTTGLINFKGGESPFQLTIDATATDIDFLFSITSTGNLCFDDASTAVISFDSARVKLTIHNSGTMNCNGFFHFNFRNTQPVPGNLQRLSTFKIASIKFTNDKKVTEVTLDGNEKAQLQQLIKCIIEQAPTLIKH